MPEANGELFESVSLNKGMGRFSAKGSSLASSKNQFNQQNTFGSSIGSSDIKPKDSLNQDTSTQINNRDTSQKLSIKSSQDMI